MSDRDYKVLQDAQTICKREAVKNGVVKCIDCLEAAGSLARVLDYHDPSREFERQEHEMPF